MKKLSKEEILIHKLFGCIFYESILKSEKEWGLVKKTKEDKSNDIK